MQMRCPLGTVLDGASTNAPFCVTASGNCVQKTLFPGICLKWSQWILRSSELWLLIFVDGDGQVSQEQAGECDLLQWLVHSGSVESAELKSGSWLHRANVFHIQTRTSGDVFQMRQQCPSRLIPADRKEMWARKIRSHHYISDDFRSLVTFHLWT